MLDDAEKRQLDELTYPVLPWFVPPGSLAELRDRVEALWTEDRNGEAQSWHADMGDAENERLSSATTRVSGFLK